MTNIWSSAVTTKMVRHLTEKEKQELIDTLNDVVERVCEHFSIE